MITIKNVEFKKAYPTPNGIDKVFMITFESEQPVNVFDVYNESGLPKLWNKQEANLVVSQISLTLFDNVIEARIKYQTSSKEFPQCYASYGKFDSCVSCILKTECEAKKNGANNE